MKSPMPADPFIILGVSPDTASTTRGAALRKPSYDDNGTAPLRWQASQREAIRG